MGIVPYNWVDECEQFSVEFTGSPEERKKQFLALGDTVYSLRATDRDFWDFWYRIDFETCVGVLLTLCKSGKIQYMYHSGDFVRTETHARGLNERFNVKYVDLKYNWDGSISLNQA